MGLKLKQVSGWTIGIIFFAVYGVALIGYDIWATINPSPQHLPLYLMPFECLGFIALLEIGRRHEQRQRAIADQAFNRGRTPTPPNVR